MACYNVNGPLSKLTRSQAWELFTLCVCVCVNIWVGWQSRRKRRRGNKKKPFWSLHFYISVTNLPDILGQALQSRSHSRASQTPLSPPSEPCDKPVVVKLYDFCYDSDGSRLVGGSLRLVWGIIGPAPGSGILVPRSLGAHTREIQSNGHDAWGDCRCKSRENITTTILLLVGTAY